MMAQDPTPERCKRGLTRRPSIGDRLTYKDGTVFVVTGFWKDESDSDIMKLRPERGGDETTAIWRFRDGLNVTFTEAS